MEPDIESLDIDTNSSTGDRGGSLLIGRFKPLVFSVARKYANYGIPLEDLVQEGLLGLMEAHNHFDTAKGAKFSTYAVYWIKNRILDALRREKVESLQALSLNDGIEVPQPDSLPAQQSELILPLGLPTLELTVLRYYYEERRTLGEIAALLGISQEKVRQLHRKSLRRLRHLLSAGRCA